MVTLKTVLEKNGKGVTLDDSELDEFSEQIRGNVIYENDERYEEACAIWNGMIDVSPTAVVRWPPMEEKYRRLVEIKNKYDLANLFRINQNIQPTV
mgnify:CR=1 FL=1